MLKKFFYPAKLPTQATTPALSGILEIQYRSQVQQRHIQFDEAQFLALQHLQTLLEKLPGLQAYQQQSIAHKLLTPVPERCRSLYIFGDVGRGKSMLMKLFYEACPLVQKRRVHFSVFMQEVHAYIHECGQRNQPEAIASLAKKIRDAALLLCFDEFHVTDIADAMILGRLFSKLFDLGIVVVITSNRHPRDLYQGGLLREQFLFFIKILQGSANIVELVAQQDYRLSYPAAQRANYHCPLDGQADAFVRQHFNELTGGSARVAGSLQIFGRQIVLSAVHQGTALASFEELCTQALGPADYLAIAAKFSTLILTDIPRLTAEKRNEAKRLVTLVDVLYEHKVKLICTAEVPAQALYTEGDGAFEFRRTVSRLIEMQSDSYGRKI
ncbi:MAG: cell division protein ZapE [Methylovulum sp.]|nr:cell division protein ZapE [Methylovulum sp.]